MKNVFTATELFGAFRVFFLTIKGNPWDFVTDLVRHNPSITYKNFEVTIKLIMNGHTKFRMTKAVEVILKKTIEYLISHNDKKILELEFAEKTMREGGCNENDYIVTCNHIKLIYDFNKTIDDIGAGNLSYSMTLDGYFLEYIFDCSE